MSVSTTLKRASVALLLGLGLVACDSGDSESSEDDEPSTATASSESTSPDEPSGGMSVPPSQQKLELGGQGQKKGRQAMMKKRLEMMKKQAEMKKKAMAAAQEAESEGDTPCEKAFHAALAIDDSMRKSLGKQPSTAEPNQDEFVSKCKSLPEGMRQCLVPSYARGNREECTKTHQGANAETKKTLQQLMTQIRGG